MTCPLESGERNQFFGLVSGLDVELGYLCTSELAEPKGRRVFQWTWLGIRIWLEGHLLRCYISIRAFH